MGLDHFIHFYLGLHSYSVVLHRQKHHISHKTYQRNIKYRMENNAFCLHRAVSDYCDINSSITKSDCNINILLF